MPTPSIPCKLTGATSSRNTDLESVSFPGFYECLEDNLAQLTAQMGALFNQRQSPVVSKDRPLVDPLPDYQESPAQPPLHCPRSFSV